MSHLSKESHSLIDQAGFNQSLMAARFQATQQNISLHLQNDYEEGELQTDATHKEFLLVRRKGPRFDRAIQHLPNPKPARCGKKKGGQR